MGGLKEPGVMDQTVKKTVPTFGYQCVAGPDLMRVEVEDGIHQLRELGLENVRRDHPAQRWSPNWGSPR